MLASSLCMVLELSELGVIGNGCLLGHKVGVHTVIKYTVESEVTQQVEMLLPVAGGRQTVPVLNSWDGSEGSYGTGTAAALVLCKMNG